MVVLRILCIFAEKYCNGKICVYSVDGLARSSDRCG